MSSLYKRANAKQRKLLKIIEGAVKNTVDAHPQWKENSPERFARSVAKRAAGTITAQWPEIVGVSPPEKP